MQKSSSQHNFPNPIFRRPPSRQLILVFLGIGLIGLPWLWGWFRTRQFDAAMQAYQSGDCPSAIAGFSQFTGDDEANRILEECQAYQAIDPATQKPSEALGKAAKFVEEYAPHNPYISDAKAVNPLLPGLRNRFNGYLKPEKIQEWLSVDVCERLEPLERSDLLPEADRSLPLLYQQCGNYFISTQQVTAGMALFEEFFDKFPQHPNLNDVKRSYALGLIKDASQQPTGEIQAPIPVANTKDGSTVVMIRNDSPYALRIALAGPTSRVEEIPACQECQEYTPSNQPSGCPAKGPVARYVLDSGDYEVLVKAINRVMEEPPTVNDEPLLDEPLSLLDEPLFEDASQATPDPSSITPFTGKWNLGKGKEYASCFFLIRQ